MSTRRTRARPSDMNEPDNGLISDISDVESITTTASARKKRNTRNNTSNSYNNNSTIDAQYNNINSTYVTSRRSTRVSSTPTKSVDSLSSPLPYAQPTPIHSSYTQLHDIHEDQVSDNEYNDIVTITKYQGSNVKTPARYQNDSTDIMSTPQYNIINKINNTTRTPGMFIITDYVEFVFAC